MPLIDPQHPDQALVWEMYRKWDVNRTPKSVLEREYFGDDKAHGKAFTAIVKRVLGIPTEQHHPMVKVIKDQAEEITRLRNLLALNNINPD